MIVVETHFYPLVLVSYRGDAFPEAEQRAALERLEALGRRAQRDGTRHAGITLGGKGMSPTERQIAAGLMADFPKELMDLHLCSYVVIDSALVRGMFTALRWLSPQIARVQTASSAEEALSACVAALDAHGTPLDEDTLRGVRRWVATEKGVSGSVVSA